MSAGISGSLQCALVSEPDLPPSFHSSRAAHIHHPERRTREIRLESGFRLRSLWRTGKEGNPKVKLSLSTPTSHMRVLLQMQGQLLPIQLPANAAGMAQVLVGLGQ